MNKIIATLVFCLSVCAFNASAQADSTDVTPDEDGSVKIFTNAQKPPSFPGGEGAWEKYLNDSLDKTLANKHVFLAKGQEKRTVTVIISFRVNKYGFVSELMAENDFYPELVREAIRVIKEGPKWIPAEQNGRKVNFHNRRAITWQVTKK